MQKIKLTLASAVMLATGGLALGTAQADSLLAPVVINDTVAGVPMGAPGTGIVPASGFLTYFAIKVRGATSFGAGGDQLHYIWIKKGTSLLNLYDPTGLLRDTNGDAVNYRNTPCTMENSPGGTSRNDMIFQQTSNYGLATNNVRPSGVPYDNAAPPVVPGSVGRDLSTPSAYPGDFVGMTVISDVANLGGGSGSPEGDMSGFAYIVNTNNGDVADYKLLNNHHSAEEGDFSIGFISKHAVDFAWLSTGLPGIPLFTANRADRVKTGWTVSVTGPDMAKHSGAYNNIYGLTVQISQQQRSGEDSPQNMGVGAYDNDERPISGDNPVNVTCMASLNVNDILTPFQIANSTNGGWMRKSIIPLADAYAGTYTPKTARGAIVYRSDSIDIDGPGGFRADRTMQVETGGHLAPGANHVNRPY